MCTPKLHFCFIFVVIYVNLFEIPTWSEYIYM